MKDSNKRSFSILRFEEYLVTKHGTLSIIFIYSMVLAIFSILFTFFIPLLMSYAPDVADFVSTYSINITSQIVIMLIPTIIIGSIILKILLRDFDKWEDLVKKNDKESKNRIARIRKKCINYPYVIYIVQVFVGLIIVAIVFLYIIISNQTDIVVLVKFIIILFALLSLVGVISLVFSKRFFSIILIKTYRDEEREGIRINIKNKILLQSIPLVLVSILITSLIGFSRLVEDRGENLFRYYKSVLQEHMNNFDDDVNEENLIKRLDTIDTEEDTSYFILSPEGKYITSNNEELPFFFQKYVEIYSDKRDGRAYDEMSLYNGVVEKIDTDEGIWRIGLKYEVTPDAVVDYFLYNLLVLSIITFLILYYTSRAISADIAVIAKELLDIADGEKVDHEFKLPIISNDEIADLTIAFNKIQEREKMHVMNIKTTNEMMSEQERFVSLGHLIGGIAHNMRTPIMSISGAMVGLEKLIDEYKTSLFNKNVTVEDHIEIAEEMRTWVRKVDPYCTYMSDILTAVKEQTAISFETDKQSFMLKDMAKTVVLLMEHELKVNKCRLNTKFNIDMEQRIKGDISNMVQIVSNLILNAIQAYGSSNGNIDFIINRIDDKAEIIIKDYGHGIPDDIKDKLFKQMVTTKGNKGTGLGLYMTYSSVRAKFKGDIWYETEINKGTAFHIKITLLQ